MPGLAPSLFMVSLAIGGTAVTAGTVQGQEYAGTETCTECHDADWEALRATIHFQTESSSDWEGRACESCHGPGAAHADSGGEVPLLFGSSGAFTSEQKTAQCLACHAALSPNFEFRSAEHPKGTVDCAGCHTAHRERPTDRLLEVVGRARNDTLTSAASHEACLKCHQEVRAATNLVSRHRIQEGMIACGDCHTQHAPSARMRLGGFQNEVCLHCHTDKQGPFVYEHLSSRVEGCTSCHVPHGSPNRHMLQFQQVADQCYSCHVIVPGFHKGFPGAPTRFDSTSVCTNCHSTIHGSNLDPYFLR